MENLSSYAQKLVVSEENPVRDLALFTSQAISSVEGLIKSKLGAFDQPRKLLVQFDPNSSDCSNTIRGYLIYAFVLQPDSRVIQRRYPSKFLSFSKLKCLSSSF